MGTRRTPTRSRQPGRKPARRRAPRHPVDGPRRGTLYLALVLAVLVGVNLYVFVFSDRSIPEVKKASVDGVDPTALLAAPEPEAAEPAAAEPAATPEGRVVDGAVKPGDSMGGILRREGLAPPEADAVIRALQPVMDLRRIRAGQTYRLRFDSAGVLQSFEFHVSRLVTVEARRQPDGSMSARKHEAPTETRVIEVGGSIETSLYHAIKAAGEDVALVAFFVDVFAFDINFFIDTRRGDTFRMIVEKRYLDGEFLGYGRVLAAEYSGEVGTYRAFWWKRPDRDEGRYYREDGSSVEKTFLKTPLKYARVSSRFNPRRMHPVLHRVRGHWGTDYAAPTGTPVWAAAGGKIVFRGRRGGAGNCVILRHANGYETLYMHLSRFQRGQRVGQYVRQKDVIGYVGATGLATGPHLHFGVKRNGRYVDPQKLKMQPGPPVPKRWMDAFRADTRELVARLAEIPVGAGDSGAGREAVAAPLPN
ncbi:MAG: M23 family metallopeptidase [Deltaproteobacteria bacterium]|nr:MAG: M23 family metallopeptidase [Deltaproteobacteria bacterium]